MKNVKFYAGYLVLVMLLMAASARAGGYYPSFPSLPLSVANGGTGAANLNAIVQTTGDQTIAGNKSFGATNFRILDSAADNFCNLKVNADLSGDRTINIPSIGGTRTLAFIDNASTWSSDQTTSANWVFNTVGKGIQVKEGSNAKMGQATLSGGTVVVNTTAVTANSRIFLTTNGGTLTNVGAPYVSARSAGTSFTITSSNALDTSNVAWYFIEPSP